MKTYFSLFIVFLFSLSLAAQGTTSLVVVSVRGKVKYESSNYQKPITLQPGAVITTDGYVHLEEGDKLTCMHGDQFFNITGKGRKSLSRAIGLIKPGTAITFDGEYSKFVKAAVEFKAIAREADGWGGITDPKTSGDGWGGITPPKEAGDGWGGITQPKTSGDGWGGITQPKTSGDGWGGITQPKTSGDGWGGITQPKTSGDGYGGITQPKTSGDGFGDGVKAIMPRLPYGNQVADVVTFRWTGPSDIKVYRLEILDSKGEVIHSQTCKKTYADIDLISLELNIGETYTWQVMPDDLESTADAHKIKFIMTSKKDLTAAMSKSSKTKLGASSDPVLKNVMQAAALELSEYYNEALLKYESALEEDPKNEMVKMQYSAFLMRLNWPEASQNVMNGQKF